MDLKFQLHKKDQKNRTAKCINHWADSANLKGVTSNKICCGLTGKRFEMPRYIYQPLPQMVKKNAECIEN